MLNRHRGLFLSYQIMKIFFRNSPLNSTSRKRLALINDIIEDYASNGLRLTLRQLYYQLVSRAIIPNKQTEYHKLSRLLKEGRMAGMVDWDAIEDRLRVVERPNSWEKPIDVLSAAARGYARPRQEGQKTHIEVWVEKDALSGVLERVTAPFHIPIMVNRGYSSASAMFDAWERFVRTGLPVTILYVGDHDPSGLDMVRDIEARIREFMANDDYPDFDFEVVPIALTSEQITQYNPPPNPAKMKDPRSADYMAEHGNMSWEVDALDAIVLHDLLQDAIESRIDLNIYQASILRETEEKKSLTKLVSNWKNTISKILKRL